MHRRAAPPLLPALEWDLFCRVVDNWGDIGVCWRLARRLAALGQPVRLWSDDTSALAWMAPQGAPGVRVLPWRGPLPGEAPGDVVIEAFGCDPPPGFVERMAASSRPPVWINLEYLTAEAYAERSHALPSPQLAGPGQGLRKWFFYPGFTAGTGGVLREDGLAGERASFCPERWLGALGIPSLPQARRVSLFCYEQPALAAWSAGWRMEPTQLLVTPGTAARQMAALLGCGGEPGTAVERASLTAHFLPWLSQPDFDRLLWSCDLNLVRGEDSLVRALWAARPFLWQPYPQHDGAHAAKLEAFLQVYLQGAPSALALPLRRRFLECNGLVAPTTPGREPQDAPWRAFAGGRSDMLACALDEQGDLACRLHRFAVDKG